MEKKYLDEIYTSMLHAFLKKILEEASHQTSYMATYLLSHKSSK